MGSYRLQTFILFAICTQFLYSQHESNPKESTSDNTLLRDSLQETKSIAFDGRDGPYLVNDTLYRVNSENKLIVEPSFDSDSLLVRVNNLARDQFYLSLKSDYKVLESSYELPDKLIVISDIEGKFNVFSSFLIANKVIDENHDWIFKDGHLVLLGDFVDRGMNVTQVLWLIYKLEYQAQLQGGRVHFILGNHEVLNFLGDHRYNRGKYVMVAQEISGEEDKRKAIKYMYSDQTELGRWLATKNAIEKIGHYLFVHAGLSPEILNYGLKLDEINQRIRTRFTKDIFENDSINDFLYGPKGPFWYRGLVVTRPNYGKIKAVELEKILSYYDSKKIVVGHTIVKDISTGYQDKVIMIDVFHGDDKFTGKTKGLFIENGEEFSIDDLGNKRKLKR